MAIAQKSADFGLARKPAAAPIVAPGMTLDDLHRLPQLERRSSPACACRAGENGRGARAAPGARLLLLDEITEGLAPVIVKKLGEVIRLLKKRGHTIVLVEQNFRFAAPLADRHYVLEHGRIVATVTQDELASKTEMLHQLLGV
ncbi:hypothetical protein ACVBEH_08030 [Roseateles sp. GG27B]